MTAACRGRRRERSSALVYREKTENAPRGGRARAAADSFSCLRMCMRVDMRAAGQGVICNLQKELRRVECDSRVAGPAARVAARARSGDAKGKARGERRAEARGDGTRTGLRRGATARTANRAARRPPTPERLQSTYGAT